MTAVKLLKGWQTGIGVQGERCLRTPPGIPRLRDLPRMPTCAAMDTLDNDRHRTDILNRLKRAEGQLRGIQRMVGEGADCQAIAMQMAAVRKALDSTYLRMVRCQMEQHLHEQQQRIQSFRGCTDG